MSEVVSTTTKKSPWKHSVSGSRVLEMTTISSFSVWLSLVCWLLLCTMQQFVKMTEAWWRHPGLPLFHCFTAAHPHPHPTSAPTPTPPPISIPPATYPPTPSKYQELLLRNECIRSMMPASVKQYTCITEAFTKSNSLSGQGADFLQEECNLDINSFLPSGSISFDVWYKVSCGADSL